MSSKETRDDSNVPDPIAEMMRIKYELGKKMDFDVDRIFEDIQRHQRESGCEYITLPKREQTPQISE
ncbi:hypothetical protein [Adhaeretor mobilis]|uniref:Uncharacterized protein n=1 Tax=Adhaeretor mobilis TaxID=1930276 RepID=A0A517N0I2_9BACT|nr:hypothetical protein [Adhaeretor mobilis]QDT00642.1 hypothetical protein HG15A2_39810 [Adhaeretor mobilis]